MAENSRDRELLKQAFEATPSVFKLLTTLRSRRVGRGYTIAPGKEETHPATGTKQFIGKDPLTFESTKAPKPLTKLEEALILWAGCGPNGIIAGDQPTNLNISTNVCMAGSTIPGPCNDSSMHFFVVNDEGTHLYRRSRGREKAVEIENEGDYGKVLKWYENNLEKVSPERPPLSWNVPAKLMGIWQWNYNKPGSTIIIPVEDMAFEQTNLLFSAPEFFGWYFIDDEGEPCVPEDFRKAHGLETGVPLRAFEELVLQSSDFPVGFALANVRLAAEALGLGAWTFGGFSKDLVLGGIPAVSKGLGFNFYTANNQNFYQGLPGVFEGYGYPSPWWKSTKQLIEKVLNARYDTHGVFFGNDTHWSCSTEKGPWKPEVRDQVTKSPKVRIPDWAVDYAQMTIDHCVKKYGRWPVHYSPLHNQIQCQLHVLDTEYYERMNVPGYVTDRIRNHDKNWNP